MASVELSMLYFAVQYGPFQCVVFHVNRADK